MSLGGLHLRGNMIGDSGALRLLASAVHLPSLQWLDLGANPINDKAVWRANTSNPPLPAISGFTLTDCLLWVFLTELLW